jgi:hypothetical protein
MIRELPWICPNAFSFDIKVTDWVPREVIIGAPNPQSSHQRWRSAGEVLDHGQALLQPTANGAALL